ncbi:MAG: hypothetical protein AAF399_00025 [Bacteroidota bacterium]
MRKIFHQLLLLTLLLGMCQMIVGKAFPSQAYHLFRSPIKPGITASLSNYWEIAIPPEFSASDVVLVKLVFVSSNKPTEIQGRMTQRYVVAQTYRTDDYRVSYQLTKQGGVEYSGESGVPGLIDHMVLEKGAAFQYVFNGTLTDDLAYRYGLSNGGQGTLDLEYIGRETDQSVAAEEQGTSSKNWYDLLVGEEEDTPSSPPSAPKEETSPWDLFTPEVEIDAQALLEKRDYEVFVLNSGKSAERGEYLVQVGYFVPPELKLGSVIRVLAIKKLAASREVVGMIEMDYYITEQTVENQLTIFQLQDMAAITTRTGEEVDLYQVEGEAF